MCHLLDLREVYDSLDRCTLLKRIGEFGVDNSVFKWFQHHLTDRTCRVKLGDWFSSWRMERRHMKAGVPKGVFLDPVLLIYMNALPLQIKSRYWQSTLMTLP